MIEQNKPATLERARKKIAQLQDATDRGDVVYRFAVASGWLAALRLEELIDSQTFGILTAELNGMHDNLAQQHPWAATSQRGAP